LSKQDSPSLLGVIDRALGSEKRAARLQKLIITVTCCFVGIFALVAAVLALSEGHPVVSLGFGGIPMLFAVAKAGKFFQRRALTRKAGIYPPGKKNER
jgi:Na+/proline symporter